ncbi:OTU domain-containing protein 6B [Thoreauomyces humboldtii]|nr:OTU domain-containing protein 6B [Thoreauomyces humboldtii]
MAEATSQESLEDLQSRHRKELKELTGKITQLKKSVGGNKQKKKEVQVQAALMERELTDRHEAERAACETRERESGRNDAPEGTGEPANGDGKDEKEGEVEGIQEDMADLSVDEPGERRKRPNKAALRKQRKAEEFAAMRRTAALDAANMDNHKENEEKALVAALAPLGLQIKQIVPDGHCMYNAISHQLTIRGEPPRSYKELRTAAAGFLRSHPDDFVPFLVTDAGDMYSSDDFEKYCNDVESTAAWGGQLELQALSRTLKLPIHVVQAGSAVIMVGEEFSGEPLFVSYHRHAYGLGEHYNSLLPVGV